MSEKRTSRRRGALSESDDLIDTALCSIEDYVDQILTMLKKKDRKRFIIKLEEFCVNHSEQRRSGAAP